MIKNPIEESIVQFDLHVRPEIQNGGVYDGWRCWPLSGGCIEVPERLVREQRRSSLHTYSILRYSIQDDQGGHHDHDELGNMFSGYIAHPHIEGMFATNEILCTYGTV